MHAAANWTGEINAVGHLAVPCFSVVATSGRVLTLGKSLTEVASFFPLFRLHE
jgi:hypothetical protein